MIQLVDARTVARALNCSPRTIRRLAQTGAIPAPIRVGKLHRWRLDAVLAHLERQQQEGRGDGRRG